MTVIINKLLNHLSMPQFLRLLRNVSGRPSLASLCSSLVQIFKGTTHWLEKWKKSVYFSAPSLNRCSPMSSKSGEWLCLCGGNKIFLPLIRQLYGRSHSVVSKCKHVLDFSSHSSPYTYTYVQCTNHTTIYDNSEYQHLNLRVAVRMKWITHNDLEYCLMYSKPQY